jgi:predicted ABC-type sugar transport system permease subunit
MNAPQKIALGSVLTVMGAAGIAFSVIFAWASLQSPWDFLLGFFLGIVAGMGAVLAISGFLEQRRLR